MFEQEQQQQTQAQGQQQTQAQGQQFFLRIGFLIDDEIRYIDSKDLQKAAQSELKTMAFIDVLTQLSGGGKS